MLTSKAKLSANVATKFGLKADTSFRAELKLPQPRKAV